MVSAGAATGPPVLAGWCGDGDGDGDGAVGRVGDSVGDSVDVAGVVWRAAVEEAPPGEDFLAEVATRLGPEMPALLGMDGPMHYLVLVQNNHELRATGGFIAAIVRPLPSSSSRDRHYPKPDTLL